MKFGKRQKKGPDADPGAPGPDPVATPGPEPVPDAPAPLVDSAIAASWTAPAPPAIDAITEPEPPVAEPEPPVHDEPVVEGEAFELFTDDPPAPAETLHVQQHQPSPPAPQPMPFPVAEQPVAVVTPGAAAAPVTTLGDVGQAFASGHAAGPSHGSGPARPAAAWQEPVMELANERPELVVGAAFAGGLLAAMILRRLGS